MSCQVAGVFGIKVDGIKDASARSLRLHREDRQGLRSTIGVASKPMSRQCIAEALVPYALKDFSENTPELDDA